MSPAEREEAGRGRGASAAVPRVSGAGALAAAARSAAHPAVDNITTVLIFAAIFLKVRNARGLTGNWTTTESQCVTHTLFWINANHVAAERRARLGEDVYLQFQAASKTARFILWEWHK